MDPEQIFEENKITGLPEIKKVAMDRWRLILGKKAETKAINFSSDNDLDSPQNPRIKEQQQKEEKNRKPGQGKGSGGAEGAKKKKSAGGGTGTGSVKIKKGAEGTSGSKKIINRPGKGKQESKSYEIAKGSNDDLPYDRNKLKEMDDTLNLIYSRTEDQKRSAGLGPSKLSIPKWIENVKELFPQETKEMLEKDLVEKSDLKDIIKNPELFEKVEPSLEMVKTIIQLKHMLPDNIKNIARKLVKKVVDKLKDKFKDGYEKHIVGAIKRDKHTPIKVFRNIDWKDSIRRNLKHYDGSIKKLIMAEPRFFSAEKKKKPWQIVVLIDESGSMTDSIIYSVVIASIFASLPAVHTNLVIFDTQVVDLSDRVNDPVDVLMTVQLGGGTDITKAVRYGQSLIKKPKKTIMVIISDFYEGYSYETLTKALKQLLEGQTKILGIAALGYNNEAMYNRQYAKSMNKLGIDLLACTPKFLPEIIAKLIQ